MFKYKNKNLKITLSFIVSTMSIIMANCMQGQGSGSSSSNVPAASGSSSSNVPAINNFLMSPLLGFLNNQNELEAKVRELEVANNDLQRRLGDAQSISLALRGDIENLRRQRVQDLEYLNRQLHQLFKQTKSLQGDIKDLHEHGKKDKEHILYLMGHMENLQRKSLLESEGRLNDIRQLDEQILSQNRETRSLPGHIEWV